MAQQGAAPDRLQLRSSFLLTALPAAGELVVLPSRATWMQFQLRIKSNGKYTGIQAYFWERIMFDQIPDVAGIYAIVNTTNGHRYVGQAKKMKTRVSSHVRDLDKGIHRTSEDRRLQNAWNEFGRDAFEIVVLEVVADNSAATSYHVRPDNLSLAEHFYINEQSEYNVDKRIVRDEFKALIDAKAWRETS